MKIIFTIYNVYGRLYDIFEILYEKNEGTKSNAQCKIYQLNREAWISD